MTESPIVLSLIESLIRPYIGIPEYALDQMAQGHSVVGNSVLGPNHALAVMSARSFLQDALRKRHEAAITPICVGCGKSEWPNDEDDLRGWMNFGPEDLWHMPCWFSRPGREGPNEKITAMRRDYEKVLQAANTEAGMKSAPSRDEVSAAVGKGSLTHKLVKRLVENLAEIERNTSLSIHDPYTAPSEGCTCPLCAGREWLSKQGGEDE